MKNEIPLPYPISFLLGFTTINDFVNFQIQRFFFFFLRDQKGNIVAIFHTRIQSFCPSLLMIILSGLKLLGFYLEAQPPSPQELFIGLLWAQVLSEAYELSVWSSSPIGKNDIPNRSKNIGDYGLGGRRSSSSYPNYLTLLF